MVFSFSDWVWFCDYVSASKGCRVGFTVWRVPAVDVVIAICTRKAFHPTRFPCPTSSILSTSRVAEKGIEAADRPMEALAAMPDIPSDASATVHAWKLLQLNTAAQLASLYGAEGRTEDGAAMERDAQDKAAYVRAAAEMEVTQVESRLAQTAGQYAGAARVLDSGWRAAVAAGFPRAWGLDLAPDPAAWLAGVRAAFAAEQAAEAAELEHQASAVEHMLGTRVQKLLAHLDTGLQGGLGALERHVNGALAEAQVARMQRTLASLTGERCYC